MAVELHPLSESTANDLPEEGQLIYQNDRTSANFLLTFSNTIPYNFNSVSLCHGIPQLPL